MSARKTARLADVVSAANVMIAAPGSTLDGRRAVAVLVERVLMDAGAYRGFRYLPSEHETDSTLREGYDDSRRAYYGGAS